MSALTVKTAKRLIHLRTILQRISTVSFAYSKLNGMFPYETLTEQTGEELAQGLEDLVLEASQALSSLIKEK